MFKPTKIIDEEEELKDYEFNEYDFDGKDNKHWDINDEYLDNLGFIKKKYFDHYIDDDDFLDDFDEEFIDEFFNNDDNFDRYKYQEIIKIDNSEVSNLRDNTL